MGEPVRSPVSGCSDPCVRSWLLPPALPAGGTAQPQQPSAGWICRGLSAGRELAEPGPRPPWRSGWAGGRKRPTPPPRSNTPNVHHNVLLTSAPDLPVCVWQDSVYRQSEGAWRELTRAVASGLCQSPSPGGHSCPGHALRAACGKEQAGLVQADDHTSTLLPSPALWPGDQPSCPQGAHRTQWELDGV